MKRRRCENCVIGVMTWDGSGRLMTVPLLLDHIKRQQELSNRYCDAKTRFMLEGLEDNPIKVYSLEDYLSGGKRTDLFRFSCCPVCGNSINFRELMENL